MVSPKPLYYIGAELCRWPSASWMQTVKVSQLKVFWYTDGACHWRSPSWRCLTLEVVALTVLATGGLRTDGASHWRSSSWRCLLLDVVALMVLATGGLRTEGACHWRSSSWRCLLLEVVVRRCLLLEVYGLTVLATGGRRTDGALHLRSSNWWLLATGGCRVPYHVSDCACTGRLRELTWTIIWDGRPSRLLP